MIEFAVIGSGISGATISNKLKKKYSIKVFEKAKGVGGRSSFKRFKGKIGFFVRQVSNCNMNFICMSFF